MGTIKLNDVSSWPSEIIKMIEVNVSEIIEYRDDLFMLEDVINDLEKLLLSHEILGYHCTRLTKEEIETIRLTGMQIQDKTSLNERIDKLGLNEYLAGLLKGKNQADDQNRKHKLWFCFYEPHYAGEIGISRLFRSWGGEALYNSHEKDIETGLALQTIGIPCVIEVEVPINILKRTPGEFIIKAFLNVQDRNDSHHVDYESYATSNISVEYIRDIISFSDERFNELTHVNSWRSFLDYL